MIVTSPDSVPYYYGHISRENAELVLFDRGCVDGMYLLRTSCSRDADYVLSLCYDQRVIHYRIIRDGDDLYYISGMEMNKYAGPVELIQNIPEFASFLSIPCLKPLNVFMPGVNCSVPEDKLKEALKKKADEWGIQESEFGAILSDRGSEVWRLVLKTLHECESWFHGRISREEAESRLASVGFENGRFLVRERDDCSFTLSLCHESHIKHYKIDVLPTGEVGIQDGPRFDNVISLVSHYSVFNDGLWCQLQLPCVVNRNSLSVSDVPQLKRSDSKSNILQEDAHASAVKSIYPHLLVEDLQGCNQRSSESVTANKGDKSSVKKGASVWFINHMPKLSRDKASANNNVRIAPQKQKPPKGKFRRLTPLDISAPVIVRRAPSPPVRPGESHVSPSSLTLVTDNGSNLDISVIDKAICATPNEYIAPKQALPSPATNQSEVPVGVTVGSMLGSDVSELPSSPNSIKLEKADMTRLNDVVPLQKKPLPAPRQRKTSGLPSVSLPSPVPSVPISPTAAENAGSMSGCIVPCSSPREVSFPKESLLREDAIELDAVAVKVFPWIANMSATQMPNVIAELKERSSRNLLAEKGSTVVESESEAADTEDKPSDSPRYEEIDPQFESCEGARLPFSRSSVASKEDEEECNGAVESLLNLELENSNWDATKDGPQTESCIKEKRKPPWTKEESELHFKTIRRFRKGPTAIDRRNLILQEKLGLGNFGDVVRAVFKSGDVEVPCAVKTLRQESISSGKEDISREARIMTKLDHPHIVRLLGVSEGDPFLLVMELAPLGPLNSYVKRNRDVPPRDVLLLLYQVALGMEYLESRQFVHRDLAARNVLLVNENFAKISDFGMSRALGLHSDYYRVEPQAKLPLKWYAPECIYYFRFSCKSDVWSYGVTLWEALSYGERPYLGLSGREILSMFSTDRRLARPEKCCIEIYDMMQKCWQFRPEDRPTFAEVTVTLKTYLNI